MLVPARLRPALRLDDPQPPRAALRSAGAARDRARHERRACSAAALALRSRPRRAARALAGGARRRGLRARPLLVARYYVLMNAALAAGPVGLPAPRRRPPAGTRRRARGDPPRDRRRRRRRRRSSLRVAAARGSPRSRSGWSRRGPAIYRQRRVGLGGARVRRAASCARWSTGAEQMGAGLAVDEGDARITRVGALLRRTSLDELPNLWNVLRGEMSLIGPRPTVPEQVAHYTERQRGRLAIRPGHHRLGAGQRPRRRCRGRSGSSSTSTTSSTARSRSTLRILARTVRVLLHGGGVYRGETAAAGTAPREVAPRRRARERATGEEDPALVTHHSQILVQREGLAVGRDRR